MNRAASVDPSLRAEANALAGQYAAYFPNKADAFMYDLTEGKAYTVTCGSLRESTTVRTR